MVPDRVGPCPRRVGVVFNQCPGAGRHPRKGLVSTFQSGPERGHSTGNQKSRLVCHCCGPVALSTQLGAQTGRQGGHNPLGGRPRPEIQGQGLGLGLGLAVPGTQEVLKSTAYALEPEYARAPVLPTLIREMGTCLSRGLCSPRPSQGLLEPVRPHLLSRWPCRCGLPPLGMLEGAGSHCVLPSVLPACRPLPAAWLTFPTKGPFG